MKSERQIYIANSFPDLHVKTTLDLDISIDELMFLKKGHFAKNMDEKWNLFILEDYIYFSRSWTGYCIYKIKYEQNKSYCRLVEILINRNPDEYNSNDIEDDVNSFKKILQSYLKRQDIFIDNRLNIDLVKNYILKYDPDNLYNKSISKQSMEINNIIFEQALNSERLQSEGIEDFFLNTSKYHKKQEIVLVHLSKKDNPKQGTTFFFDEEISKYLGQITIKEKS